MYTVFGSLIQNNCRNVCLHVSFLDVTLSCFQSLVPCLKYTLRNVAAKQVTDVSLVLKDSDMESENLSSLIRISVFKFRWPENRPFKSCIIYRYIYCTNIKSLYSYLVLGQNRKGQRGRVGRLDEDNNKSILRELVHQRNKRDKVNTILHRVNKAKLSQPGRTSNRTIVPTIVTKV